MLINERVFDLFRKIKECELFFCVFNFIEYVKDDGFFWLFKEKVLVFMFVKINKSKICEEIVLLFLEYC